jgi:hypothetical protein
MLPSKSGCTKTPVWPRVVLEEDRTVVDALNDKTKTGIAREHEIRAHYSQRAGRRIHLFVREG